MKAFYAIDESSRETELVREKIYENQRGILERNNLFAHMEILVVSNNITGSITEFHAGPTGVQLKSNHDRVDLIAWRR